MQGSYEVGDVSLGDFAKIMSDVAASIVPSLMTLTFKEEKCFPLKVLAFF